jgi:hypothetical protein
VDLNDYVNYAERQVTGGGMLDLFLDRTLVEDFVVDAVERVRPWYREAPNFETVDVTMVKGQAGYVDTDGSLSAPVHVVEELIPVEIHHAGDYVLQEISDLLGLPHGLWQSTQISNYAQWLQARRQIVAAMGKRMSFRYVEGSEYGQGRIWIDDVAWQKDRVTVVYCPLPVAPDDVKYGPAITWMKDWVHFSTQKKRAEVMGQFTGEGTVSTNAADLRAEAVDKLSKLMEDLRDLQFSYTTFSRKG